MEERDAWGSAAGLEAGGASALARRSHGKYPLTILCLLTNLLSYLCCCYKSTVLALETKAGMQGVTHSKTLCQLILKMTQTHFET